MTSIITDDRELARRSIVNFGELLAALGHGAVGPEVVVRRADALGARIDAAATNPWFDGAVVPPDAEPPQDSPELPGCVWTVAEAVTGRVEDPAIATPCLGTALAGLAPAADHAVWRVEAPSAAELGDVNERAYGEVGVFGPLVRALDDPRIGLHGVRVDGRLVCVAMTLTVGDDLGVHYVATEDDHRRQGLASWLVARLMTDATARGLRTATLQASALGLPVWQRLGFRLVATLRGFVRPTPPMASPPA